MAKAHGANSDTSAATKKRMLDAALAELRESSWEADPFPGISLAKVAHRAGLSRNGLANHWPTKELFSKALAERVLGSDEFWDADYEATTERINEAQAMTPFQGLLYVVRHELEQIGRHDDWPAGQALLVTAAHDPDLTLVAREGYASDTAREWETVLLPLLSRMNRVPRPPLSGLDVAAAYVALLEGAAMQQLVGTDLLTRGRDELLRSQNLFSVAALALLLGLTVESDSGEGSDSTVPESWLTVD